MKLSPAEVDAFFSRGYLVRERLFGEDEVAGLRSAFDRVYAESRGLGAETGMHRGARFVFQGEHLHRVVWAGAVEPDLLATGEDPRLLGPALQLLGSERAVQIINQCHFKMPGDGVAFRWHQDSQNRRYGTEDWTDVNGRGSFVQTILAVDPMTEDNGPLVVYPGSCARGHLGLSGAEEDIPFDPATREPLLVPAGSVVYLGPYTIHGSGPNTSARPRRVLINGYAAPGANRFAYPGCGTGRVLDGAAA